MSVGSAVAVSGAIGSVITVGCRLLGGVRIWAGGISSIDDGVSCRGRGKMTST